ncbi:N-acetyl-gamma-glutamyl-phosphate reductase [Oceanobacillus kapialis]|uniref:N-acetyl-gamma-glutamyl-phosphate reductase n=1 Tax=Oceanobacillus kapialis TaxID=481353 RepID=A0ABW5Q3R6_9BACI
MKQAAIVGGTGYGAIELIRLLHSHSEIELVNIYSHSQHETAISSVYPHLKNIENTTLDSLDIAALTKNVDIVFFATPAGIAKEFIPKIGNGIQCIDLSGDLRLSSRDAYKNWYKAEAADQSLLDVAVYGLSEINRQKIKEATILSNPGCFPTAALLGLIPALQNEYIHTEGIVIDGKTGISGAGKTPSARTHFPETNDNITAYKIGQHQHIPEIDQYLSEHCSTTVHATLTTHLVPMTRGIICTMYGKVNGYYTTEKILSDYQHFYEGNQFVRVLDAGEFPTTKGVYGSNFCDIGLHVDSRTNQLIIVSAIDNLMKGAAGQAIQNVNIMNGWNENNGLKHIPIYP